jgi:hypothetical protein
VGFDQGGLLTEAVTKQPHCVLLLDEIEKAHPDVFNILLQVMDHGTLTDNNGRKSDFRNVILVMTTNAGAEALNKPNIGFSNTRESGDEMADIKRMFSPEFRNRLDAIVPFASLNEDVILRVVDKFLMQLEDQLHDKRVDASFTDALRAHLGKHGFDPLMGARPMQRLIQDTLRRALADELLFGKLVDGGSVLVDVDADGVLEAVGDATDYYVFCYACGVRSAAEEVYRWDGSAFVAQKILPSDDATIQAAITAAEAGRWNMVAATLATVQTPSNEQDAWTVVLLKRAAALRAPTADDASPFMSALLYGDYDAAVGVLKRYQPKALVDTQNPAFPSDLAPFGELVVDSVVRLSTTVLAQDATLTSAQFLRGWAQTLLDPKNAAGLADLEAVAAIDPFYAAVQAAVLNR